MANLECKGLTKSFGSTPVLQDVDLTLEPGRILGLLGPNGSGKTTLIKTVMGFLTPDSGSVQIAGFAPGREAKTMVSYLPERNSLPIWMNAAQLIRFYQDFFADFDETRAKEMLEHLGVPDRKPLKQLSKGTREKVELILTMSRRAKLYLLDEPIGGVDPATRDYILQTIIGNFDTEASLLISTHLIADVEQILDDVIFINNGHIVLSAAADALREEKGKSIDMLFREVFKC